MMKNISGILLAAVLAFGMPSCNSAPTHDTTNAKDTLEYPLDLALIYHGGTQRKDWNVRQLQPYVYRMKAGKLQWLFDGFLFLEITTRMHDTTYSFVVDKHPADKLLWEDLLDRTFTAGGGPDALNQLLDSLAHTGQVPPYRRKVIISIPNPVYGDQQWGTLEGQKLDFTHDDDRVQAATWFVDQVLKTWKKNNYKHLQLAGFYWVHESVANKSDSSVIHRVSTYLDNKGFNFYWIPYYGAGRAGDWKALGFDMAYQQPNYFFNLKTPHSTLTDALKFAKDHKMELEMEFDGRLIKQPDYRKRFFDYLQAFKNDGVWENKHVAYYEGGGAWLDMSNHQDTAVQRAFNALADILAERKLKGIKQNVKK